MCMIHMIYVVHVIYGMYGAKLINFAPLFILTWNKKSKTLYLWKLVN